MGVSICKKICCLFCFCFYVLLFVVNGSVGSAVMSLRSSAGELRISVRSAIRRPQRSQGCRGINSQSVLVASLTPRMARSTFWAAPCAALRKLVIINSWNNNNNKWCFYFFYSFFKMLKKSLWTRHSKMAPKNEKFQTKKRTKEQKRKRKECLRVNVYDK